MNEQEKFLNDLGSDQNNGEVDILDQPLDGSTTAKVEETTEEGGTTTEEATGDEDGDDVLKPRNRRERRLLRKLDAERGSSMFLAGKLEAREEARIAVTEESDYLKAVERIYGMDTPEATLATDLLKKAIVGAREDAKRLAIEEIRRERQQEVEAEKAAQREFDTIIDDIEDTYDVTLTDVQEKGYFDLLRKMSPKNDAGQVVKLADPHAVWEIFQDKLKSKGTDNRAKTLSSRSMVRSGSSKESTLQGDTTARFLQESGII